MYRIILILSITLFTAPLFADEAEDKAEFKRLYAEFNELFENSEDIEPIIEVAGNVFTLSKEVYGKHSLQRAVAAYNLATLYQELAESNQGQQYFWMAANLYETYFDVLRRKRTPIDRDYFDKYINFVKIDISANINGKGVSSADKLRKMAKKLNISGLEKANVEFIIGIRLFLDKSYGSSKTAFEKSAYLYSQKLGENHLSVAENLFWIGKLDFAAGRYKQAEEVLLRALKTTDYNGQKGKKIASSVQSFLIAVYEETGRQDEATKHCVALSEERTGDFDRFLTPLYKKNPKYPMTQRSGEVVLGFKVDKNGFAREITVLESSYEKFNQASIVALAGSRFAPTVIDGDRIVTTDLKQKYSYRMTIRR